MIWASYFLRCFLHSKREYSGLYDRWEGWKQPKRWGWHLVGMLHFSLKSYQVVILPSLNGHGACPCGARCLPQVGTTSIQNVPKAFQRRNARKGDEKPSIPRWHFDDTLMILFCKESRKVSLSQLVGTMDFIWMEKLENDTMTLLHRKMRVCQQHDTPSMTLVYLIK